MPQPLALSTAYFTLRDPAPPGEAMVAEALALGFRALELDYRVTPAQLRGLAPALARGELTPVSIHHPFPLTPGVSPEEAHQERPNLASLDRDERRAAVGRVCDTLSRAADLGVGVVVLHAGRAELDPEADPRALEALYREGRRATPGYEELRGRVAAARQRVAPAHRDALLSALDRVAAWAAKSAVAVGLENRYHPEELPDPGELAVVFRELAGAPLGYWHDVGHAEALAALGFLASPTEVLAACPGRLLGFHLHDARGLEDHRAPGEGAVDFAALAPFATEHPRLVLEIHPRSPADAVVGARAVLRAAGFPVA